MTGIQTEQYVQLQMLWPRERMAVPPVPLLSPEYHLRTFQRGDEARFYKVMEIAGWPGWDDAKLAPWLPRLVADGWFVAVYTATDQIVASCMAFHDPSDLHPNGGEIGWVASDLSHRGRGLGLAVCAAATAHLLAAGYRNIHLYTEHWRFPAIKTYLKLGFLPLLHQRDMALRWERVCAHLGWPYTPEEWPTHG